MTTEEAYKEYRKQYKKQWYQRNRKRQDFLQWLRNNPSYKEVKDAEQLYYEFGGAGATRVIKKRLREQN